MRVRFLALLIAFALVGQSVAPLAALAEEHELESVDGVPTVATQSAMDPYPGDAFGTFDALPSEPVSSVLTTPSVVASTPPLPFAFKTIRFKVRMVPDSQLPFNTPYPIPKVDTGLHDSAGVRLKMFNGVAYDHASVSGHYGVENLNAYRLTGNKLYLNRAKAQAKRMMDKAIESDGAWIQPYYFEWGQYHDLPWYSGLGQARALMLFSRLAEVTGEKVYRDAADKMFNCFLVEGPTDKPWFVNVDEHGHLWFQEYPGAKPDYTYNGHTVAVYAMYDYYRLTGDPRAYQMFLGGATTVLEDAAEIRQPGRRSRYCLSHTFTASRAYHAIHVKFFGYFWRLIDDTRWPRLADSFQADFPPDRLPGYITLRAGTHDAVSPSGKTTHIRVPYTMQVHISFRRRLAGKPGYYFYVGDPYARYWVKEAAGKAFYAGSVARVDYWPNRKLEVPRRGTYVLRRFSSTGKIMATKKMRFSASSTGTSILPIRARSVQRGVSSVLVAAGPYTGYWIELRNGVSLR